MVSFRRAKTTINPFKPDASSALVTSGVYRFMRNPMYVGLLLTLSGWTAFLASLPALVSLFLFLYVVYINRFQIAPEERMLSSRFREDYATYQKRSSLGVKLHDGQAPMGSGRKFFAKKPGLAFAVSAIRVRSR